jgi:tetratricopeptide (TPR) repeat protein
VLAALDLAEPEPLWKTVIERLRLAAAGEGNAGRARAALVYALAKSGDAPGARAELAKLDALTRPYPVLPNLHALVDRAASKAVPDAGAAATMTSSRAVASGAAAQTTAPDQPSGGPAPGAGDAVPSDPRMAMQMAALAVKKGELVRARQIYESVVGHNPSDSEALAGLGDIARLDGDPALAISRYKRAIAVNPSYLPALLGLADTQWSSGDHAGAARGYTEIVDRFPEGTYPSFVKQRSEAGGTAPPPAAPTTTTKLTPSSTPPGARTE